MSSSSVISRFNKKNDDDDSHLMAWRSSNISATTIPASIKTSTHMAIWNGLDSNTFTDLARHLITQQHCHITYHFPVAS